MHALAIIHELPLGDWRSMRRYNSVNSIGLRNKKLAPPVPDFSTSASNSFKLVNQLHKVVETAAAGFAVPRDVFRRCLAHEIGNLSLAHVGRFQAPNAKSVAKRVRGDARFHFEMLGVAAELPAERRIGPDSPATVGEYQVGRGGIQPLFQGRKVTDNLSRQSDDSRFAGRVSFVLPEDRDALIKIRLFPSQKTHFARPRPGLPEEPQGTTESLCCESGRLEWRFFGQVEQRPVIVLVNCRTRLERRQCAGISTERAALNQAIGFGPSETCHYAPHAAGLGMRACPFGMRVKPCQQLGLPERIDGTLAKIAGKRTESELQLFQRPNGHRSQADAGFVGAQKLTYHVGNAKADGVGLGIEQFQKLHGGTPFRCCWKGQEVRRGKGNSLGFNRHDRRGAIVVAALGLQSA